jgi:hypothetical protein
MLTRHSTNTVGFWEETFETAAMTARLDPFCLPQRFRYDTGVDPHDGRPLGQATVLLDADQALVSRPLPSGAPATMRMPMSVFEGVAVRILPDRVDAHGETIPDGRVVIELLHRDPQLSVPLSVVDDLDDVVADWKVWSRVLSLPMLLVESDGSWRPVDHRLGAIAVAGPKPRRRRSVLAGRRPRFLVRRKVGVMPARPIVVGGYEMFGRD